jgi:thiosulfate reductase cytochrome b subunit
MLVRASDAHVLLHPAIVRLAHWTWAVGVVILIGSGWRVYNQEPLFGFTFPNWMTIGGTFEDAQRVHNDIGLAGALLWHFSAMWLLFISIFVYVVYGLLSGHFRDKFLPIWPRQIVSDVAAFLRGKLPHDLGTRNAVQRALYTFAIIDLIIMIWTGLVLWKPTQLQELGWLTGGYDGARYLHFFGMVGIVLFLLVHIALTLMVPKVLPPMITGRAPREAVVPQAGGMP